MKNFKLISFLISVILILSLSVCVFAYNGPALVYDEAGILSEDELSSLTEFAESVSDEYKCSIVVAAVNNLNGYSNIEKFADDFFDSNNLGYGQSDDGIMLIICMSTRDYAVLADGRGVDLFTDYGRDYIISQFKSKLSSGNYYGAFKTFINESVKLIKYYNSNGCAFDNYKPSSSDTNRAFSLKGVIIGLLAGIGLGGVPLNRQKKSLQTVLAKANANDYTNGSLRLSVNNDTFVTKNVTRTPIPRDADYKGHGGSGGGSTVHTASSGHSHSVTSGKF